MKYLAVKNFAEHQHYRDRIPPWIKFYNRILDDYEFIQLGGAARSHLMLIWLLASRHKNRIPFDPKYISGAIHARERVDLDALIGAGWLLVVEDSDSTDASSGASTDASKTGDVEREREGEREKAPASPRKAASGKKPDRTWLSPYCEAWKAEYDGEMPVEPNVAALRSLEKARGAGETLRRWTILLAGTESKYASAAKLKSGWGDYDQPKHRAALPGRAIAFQDEASVLWDRYKTHNLLTRWPAEEYPRIAARMVDEGHYPSVPAVLDELRVTQPWSLADARTDQWAIGEVAKRLAGPRKVAV